MISIEVNNLSKKYKNKFAVDNLSLSVNKGEIFSLLGTNGAGKTTTIKILSTLIEPTNGTATIEGNDILNNKMNIREIINVSPQETAIASNLTVKENLEFMADVYRVSNPKEKINELIDLFKLNDVLRQRGKTLSGGWQRKISIAISLINEPRVLFLDEPTLGLDVITRKELWKIIGNLKNKTTVILTTHYMEEAEFLSDRVAIMNKGKLIAIGTPEEIKVHAGKENFEDAFTSLVTGGEL